jgi:hypothetical protein
MSSDKNVARWKKDAVPFAEPVDLTARQSAIRYVPNDCRAFFIAGRRK